MATLLAPRNRRAPIGQVPVCGTHSIANRDVGYGGFYLALGPALVLTLLQSENRVAGGSVITALLGVAAIASAVTQAARAPTAVTRGSLLLVCGVGITLFAFATGSGVILYIGSVIA